MLMAAPIFLILLALIIFGMPVVTALGLSSFAWLLLSGQNAAAIPVSFYGGINNYVQMAVPFFVLAGEIMNGTGITERIIRFSQMLLGRFKGGLAYATIFTSMLFAGITGAGVADVSALGAVFIPAMEKRGYPKKWASALVAGAAVIGPTIPPSIIAVLYGAVTGVSIGALLIAGIMPGVILGFTMAVYVNYAARKRNFPVDETKYTVKERISITKDTTLAMVMPIIIIGGILSGTFTPTEAAAAAVFYAFFVGLLIFKTVTKKLIYDSFVVTVKTSANMYLLMAAGAVLSWMLAKTGLPVALANWLLASSNSLVMVWIFGIGLALFLGCFMDNGVACILIAPILAPIAKASGIHPVHFGACMILALNIGLITPPFGMNIFASVAVGGARFDEVAREIGPYLFTCVITLLLLILFPSISLIIPRLTGLA